MLYYHDKFKDVVVHKEYSNSKVRQVVVETPFDLNNHKHYILKSGSYPMPDMYLELINVRDQEIVFDVPGMYEDVFNYIDKFFSSKDFYTREKIFYKTGLLLYGPPGNSKTSW